MSPRRDIDQLGLPEGYTLEQSPGTAHLRVMCPDGTPLRMPSGIPVVVSLTPSDWRTRKTEASRIKRALRKQEAGL